MEPVRRHLVAIDRHRPAVRAAVHRHLVAIPRGRLDPEPTLVLEPGAPEPPATRSVLAVLASFALLSLLCCGAVVSVLRVT
ncbi:hypothetical protein BJY16_004356 [Actinoplanes octamycinicus]|uniref:Uncharacterized protein n=1 Tax=Actinoplanes octamycinicus TaxID=135948 RepID=A0A7W7M8F7_9ACTN|nr:hypothetical protein [Actinoplanes octamycinicus]MBB4740897.1 hypothetical protein [Actinoplanes octamycinicus]GIE55804.1 hypothetical protein Aoc01nite_12060 [Actinoplanes octamycinicus]